MLPIGKCLSEFSKEQCRQHLELLYAREQHDGNCRKDTVLYFRRPQQLSDQVWRWNSLGAYLPGERGPGTLCGKRRLHHWSGPGDHWRKVSRCCFQNRCCLPACLGCIFLHLSLRFSFNENNREFEFTEHYFGHDAEPNSASHEQRHCTAAAAAQQGFLSDWRRPKHHLDLLCLEQGWL